MLDFRDWWFERIETQGLTANSGNKDLIHLGGMLKKVVQMKRLGIDLPLGGLSFKENGSKTRPPFSAAWIRDRLLAPGALDGLNEEARTIVLVMVNTGCRPSEIASLTADQIKLKTNVPHIRIEPVGRQLKSANARRVVTLAGVSLEALRGFPSGFPRYQKNSAGLSATVNKFLRSNGLLETPDHSLYSLRHAFEDRMLRAGVDERIRRDVMGQIEQPAVWKFCCERVTHPGIPFDAGLGFGGPFLVDLHQDGADQSQQGVVAWKDPDLCGAPLELLLNGSLHRV